MILLSARKLNLSVQYDDDKWNSFRASAWAQKSWLIPSSSFVSSSWNSSLSPSDSPLRSSLLTVDSCLGVGSWNSWSLPDNFAEPSATGKNSPSFWIIKTSFAFSLLGYVSDASNFSNSSISAIRISSSQVPPANKACPRRIPHIFVHCEISRLPGGLGHLADSNGIP